MKRERQTEGGRKRGREGGKVCSPCIPLPPPPPQPAGAAEWQQREKVGGSEELKKKKKTEQPGLAVLLSFCFSVQI